MSDRPAERVCRRCGETKPLEDFSNEPKGRWGKAHTCKACITARMKRWIQENPERNRRAQREIKRRQRAERHDAVLARTLQSAARQRGAKVIDLVVPLVVLERDDGMCGICGEDVDPFDFHLDHIVSCLDGGEHSYANIQIAHPGCNVRKGVRERDARKVAA